MSTQVILTAKVDKLGDEGASVKVADGFARNYLIPQGLAMPATAANLKRIESLRKKREADHAASLSEAHEIVTKLSKGSFSISVAAGADEKLFGSVTSADIVEALKKDGIIIDRKKIMLEHPIRALGVYDIEVKLHAEVTTKVKIFVEAAEGVTPAPAAASPAEGSKKSKKK